MRVSVFPGPFGIPARLDRTIYELPALVDQNPFIREDEDDDEDDDDEDDEDED